MGFNDNGSFPYKGFKSLEECLCGTGIRELVELQEMIINKKDNDSSDEYLDRVFHSLCSVFHFIHSNNHDLSSEEIMENYIYLQARWHMFKYFGYSEAWYLEGGFSACLFE